MTLHENNIHFQAVERINCIIMAAYPTIFNFQFVPPRFDFGINIFDNDYEVKSIISDVDWNEPVKIFENDSDVAMQ